MVQQTIQFESVSLSEIGSGSITAFLFSGDTLEATLANITENGTLKGRYTGTVDDIAAVEYRLVVKFNGFTVNDPDEVVTLLLAVGTYVAERHAVLNTAYLYEDEGGRKAINANVTHYQGTLQGNGDLPAKLDAIKDVTNKIDTGLVLDGVVWQFTVNMLEAAIAEVPKYGDTQKHTQEDYNVINKTVDVTVTKVT